MTPDDQIIRANDAKFILGSPIFQEARKDIEGKLQYLRRSCNITDTHTHTRVVLMEQLWGYLLDYFEQIAQTGKLAELRLEEERKRQSLLEKGVALWRTGRNAL